MGDLFSPDIKINAPKPPDPKQLAAEDLARKQREADALRASMYERQRVLATRGRTSLTNPGLAIPE